MVGVHGGLLGSHWPLLQNYQNLGCLESPDVPRSLTHLSQPAQAKSTAWFSVLCLFCLLPAGELLAEYLKLEEWLATSIPKLCVQSL